MQKKVMLAFDDPGGGLAVSSLIDRLNKEDVELKIFSGKLSERFLKEKKIKYNELGTYIDRIDAQKFIDEFKPELIITGTSGGNSEQQLRNIAFEKKIKSIVILDFWKDYSRRWLYSEYDIDKTEDKIFVMDEPTKSEMIEENFPEEKLFVTGHPYLDYIFNKTDYSEDADVNYKEFAKTILYLSQPFDIIGVKDYRTHPLEILFNALARLSDRIKERFIVNIKLHPSEKISEELKAIIKKTGNDNFVINLKSENEMTGDLIKESDIVIGYNTIAMFESRAMNKRTLSLDAAKITNSLSNAMKNAGIERVEPDEDKILELLMTKPIVEPVRNLFKGGIENSIAIILSELNSN